MTRRAKIGAGVLLVAALAALAALLSHRVLGRTPAAATSAAPVAVVRAKLPYVPAGKARLGWLFEPGVPARRLAGTVSAGGTPVAGARVEARPWLVRSDADEDPAATAVSDAAGHFDLGELPAGAWVIGAAHEGWGPGATRVDSHDPDAQPAPDALVVELGACAARLVGRVLDVDGRPIAGAEIRNAARWYGAGLAVARSAADGGFEICVREARPTAPVAMLSVWAPGYERFGTVLTELPAAPVELRLFAAAAVEGVVVDAEGQAVEGARVEASAPGLSIDRHTAVSGAGGAFRIENLSPGRNELEAEHPDFGRSSGTRVQVGAGTTTPGVLVVLGERCRRLAGIVREGGRPLAGVAILGTFTQADGSFVARCQPTASIEPFVPGYQVESPAAIPAGELPIDDLVIRLGRGAAVHGVVRDGAGRPIAGARVFPSGSDMMARALRRGDVGVGEASSDTEGRYRIGGLPAGVIELRAEDGQGNRSPMVALELSPAADVALDLTLVASGRVHGVVRDPSGRLAAHVAVQAEGGEPDDPRAFAADAPRSESDAAGRYTLAGLSPSSYTIRAAPLTPADGAWPQVELAAGGDVTLDLKVAETAGRAIAGTVRYSDGSPAAGARLRGSATPLTSVREDGSFRIDGLTRDRYDFQIIAGDGTLTELTDVHAGDEHVQVTLERPGRVEGAIQGGRDDDTWSVNVRREGGGAGWAADVRGARFVTSALAPGHYRVLVTGAHGRGDGRVDVLEGDTAELTVTIAASGVVTGVVRVFPGGAPAPGLDCHALADTHAQSAADGSFRLADVPPGPQSVRCESPEGATQRKGFAAFVLAPGGSARIEVWVVDVDDQRVQSERQVADLGADLVPAAGGSVALAHVVAAGPAARAGLADGDVVVLVDGADATGPRSAAVAAYVDARVPGSKLALSVRRATSEVHAVVTLGAKDY